MTPTVSDEHEGTALDGRPAVANRRRNVVGLLLVAGGAVILMANLGLFGWVEWDIVWPVAFIAVGLALLIGRFRGA